MVKIAVVTGANKGLGFEACRQLGKKGFKVILTSRDEKKGKEAVGKLKKENLDIIYHKLDVTNLKDINSLKIFIEKEFGKLDVLINNAGVLLDFEETLIDYNLDKIRETIETNTFGPLQISVALLQIMKKNKYGRIVNVSSGMGQLTEMTGSFCPGYRISKTALNAVTKMLASEVKGYNILVNSVCPGWVKTDMGGKEAEREIEEGVETIIWLATLPDNVINGGFFRDKELIEW